MAELVEDLAADAAVADSDYAQQLMKNDPAPSSVPATPPQPTRPLYDMLSQHKYMTEQEGPALQQQEDSSFNFMVSNPDGAQPTDSFKKNLKYQPADTDPEEGISDQARQIRKNLLTTTTDSRPIMSPGDAWDEARYQRSVHKDDRDVLGDQIRGRIKWTRAQQPKRFFGLFGGGHESYGATFVSSEPYWNNDYFGGFHTYLHP